MADKLKPARIPRPSRRPTDVAPQFLVVLAGTEPLVWRRIQVPEKYSFWDLHVAIQDVMGWQDYHLHEFRVVHPEQERRDRIGIPMAEFVDDVPNLPKHSAKAEARRLRRQCTDDVRPTSFPAARDIPRARA